MIEHHGPVSGVAASDGGLVATAGYDNRLILWRGRTALARAWHDHLVNQCAFEPEGRFVVSASSDYTARLWSVPDLRLLAVLGGHDDDVEMAVFDPGGSRVATASRDHGVRIFSVTGELLTHARGHDADALTVAWVGRGSELVSSGDDGTVRRWDAASGELLQVTHLGAETDTVVVDASGTVFAGNDRGEIVVVSTAGDTRCFEAHRAGVKRLALDRSGRCLMSTSYDRTLKMWRVDGDRLTLTCSTSVPAEVWARGASFCADGRVLLGTFGSSYAVFDSACDRWDLDGVRDTAGLNAVHFGDASVYAIGDAGRVYADGREVGNVGSLCNFVRPWAGRLVSGGHVGALFDCRTGQVLHQHASPLNCATVLDDGDLLVGTYTGEGLRLRAEGDNVVVRETLRLHEQAVKGIAVSGGRISSVSAAGDAAFHQLDPHRVLRIPGAHDRIANGVCALSDGRFATVSRDRMLRLWTGDAPQIVATPHTHSIKCVAATADARHVATGSYDGVVAFFDLIEGRWVSVVRPTCAGISSMCASPEADAVLVSAYDGRIFVAHAGGKVATLHESAGVSASGRAPRD